jgi:HSP20 family protein
MVEERESQVIRWDPFGSLTTRDPWGIQASGGFGQLLDQAFGERVRTAAVTTPVVDITETENEYTIAAEVPGVKRDDLTLEIHEGTLTLRGEKKSEREESKERARRLERSYGAFTRSFAMPSDAEVSKVDASFADGVLRIVIPKKPEAKPALVAIKA